MFYFCSPTLSRLRERFMTNSLNPLSFGNDCNGCPITVSPKTGNKESRWSCFTGDILLLGLPMLNQAQAICLIDKLL